MRLAFARSDLCRELPLSRHYFSALFDEQLVSVLSADRAPSERYVTWGLGVLADSDWEVLGAWPAPNAGQPCWTGLFDKFAVRGVERVSFVLADAVADVGAACPRATVLLPFTRIQRRGDVSLASGAGLLCVEARRAMREAESVRGARAALERLLAQSEAGRAAVLAPDWPEVLAQLEPFYALRPARRALVRRGDEVSEHLGRWLSRAVGRHGPFADVDAATSFVARALARAESQLSSFVRPAIRLPARRADVLAARGGVTAPGR